MAKGGGWAPRWLGHKQLLATEATLLVAVGTELLQRQVAASQAPNWAKTLYLMAVNAGMLGGVLLAVLWLVRWSLERTTAVAKVLPAPLLVIHLAALAGIFVLYAWVWGFPLWWSAPAP